MRFTRSGIFLLLAVLILNGCAGAAKKDDERSTTADDQTLSADTGEVTEPVFVAIPKPQAVPVEVPASARKEFAEAKQALKQKKYQVAVERLLLMTETYPQLAGVYVNLGIAYAKLEDYDKAVSAYRFAIEKNPLNFDAYTNLGVVLRNQGKFTEAEAVYLDALELWPHHRDSLVNLGVLYDMYMGKLPEALAQFELAQKLNAEEDRQLMGWIVDLQRRLAK